MVTLKDVAELAGVSIATVSYVVNGTRSVKPATRIKVLSAVEQLNYIPNSSARNLKTRDSNEIGVVFPSIDDFCHSEILKGIAFSLGEKNFSLNIAFSYGIEKLEQQIIDNFISKNISGLIIMTCQPDNTAYFQQSIVKYDVPNVFLERFPNNIDVNFLAFDNYNTIYFLTQNLIRAGYSRITLIVGNPAFFSEGECIRGYTDAMDDLQLPQSMHSVISIKMGKEFAFRAAAELRQKYHSQAVIVSSDSIAKGIMEAYSLDNLKIGEDITLITLGEDCWNKSNYAPNLLHTSRTAYTLGEAAVDTLLRDIQSSQFLDKEFMLFRDNIIGTTLKLPSPHTLNAPHISKATKKFRIISADLSTIHAAEIISSEFCLQNNVEISFEYTNYRDLFKTILSDSKKEVPEYDVYLYDVSWLSYLAQEKCLLDITDFINNTPFVTKRIMKKNLDNCFFRGRCYGFPIIGGTQLLFYRRDLFEDKTIQKQFQAHHHISLRPPKTWKEFNGIARFFTREFNPDSPTEFGTSIAGDISEALALDYYIRMWSFGGGFADRNRRLSLNTIQNEKAVMNLIESCRYTRGDIFNCSIDDSFAEFGSGKAAMIISYTEYAAQIQKYIQSNIITKIGYAMVPGYHPANVGWHFGISPNSKNCSIIKDFFQWLCLRHTSYYMTILSGQSVITYPYKNHEILKLYPWLKATEEGLDISISRKYPYNARTRNIAPFEIETILSDMMRKILSNQATTSEGLQAAQKELLKLFQS